MQNCHELDILWYVHPSSKNWMIIVGLRVDCRWLHRQYLEKVWGFPRVLMRHLHPAEPEPKPQITLKKSQAVGNQIKVWCYHICHPQELISDPSFQRNWIDSLSLLILGWMSYLNFRGGASQVGAFSSPINRHWEFISISKLIGKPNAINLPSGLDMYHPFIAILGIVGYWVCHRTSY